MSRDALNSFRHFLGQDMNLTERTRNEFLTKKYRTRVSVINTKIRSYCTSLKYAHLV